MTEHSAKIITTDVYTTAPPAYLKALARVWLGRYGVLLVMPPVALVIVGVMIDLRLIVVALALVFVVAPMIMTLLYFNYMLVPETRRAVLPHSAVVEPQRALRIIYHNTDAGDDTGEAAAADSRPLPPDETIAWSDIAAITRRGASTVFRLRGDRLRLFIIPDSVIKTS